MKATASRKPIVVKHSKSPAAVGVKIYRLPREGGEYFQVADHSTGTRRLRSFGTRADAIAEAERISRLLSGGQAEAARMTNFEAASYGKAIELLRDTGDALEIACHRYAEAVKVLGSGSLLLKAAETFAAQLHLPDKTVAEVAAELIAEKSGGKKKRSPRTIEDLEGRLERFSKDFTGQIKAITKGEIQAWLDRLPTSERDKTNQRAKLHQLFQWAWRRDYILENPVKKVERPQVEEGEVSIYTPDEISRLLKAARKDFRPFVALAAFAGLRSSEIQRLEWSAIDFAAGTITLKGRKRGSSRRHVPIQPNLAAWLADYSERKGRVWNCNDDETCDEQIRCAKATATAELPAVVWKHNGLRHSFCSHRLAVTKDAAAAALEAGNSEDVIHNRYKQLVTEQTGRAWFAVSPEQPANVVSISKGIKAA